MTTIPPVMADDEAMRIASKLTKAQRETVMRWAGTYDEVMAPVLDPLWFCIAKDEPGYFRLSPTNLGLRVRAALQSEASDGQ